METSNPIVTLRQWAGVLLLGSLLIMGPIAAVTARPAVTMMQHDDLFVPDPLLVDTIGLLKDTMEITTSYEQAEYLNAQAIISTVDHTADRITGVGTTKSGREVSGTTTVTISGQGITTSMWLSDQGGEQWFGILDSVVEIDEGFQLLGSFIHSVDGVVVSDEPFEAILGFDGSLTMVGDVENLEILLESLMGHVAHAERIPSVAPVLGVMLLILLVVVVFCVWYIFARMREKPSSFQRWIIICRIRTLPDERR